MINRCELHYNNKKISLDKTKSPKSKDEIKLKRKTRSFHTIEPIEQHNEPVNIIKPLSKIADHQLVYYQLNSINLKASANNNKSNKNQTNLKNKLQTVHQNFQCPFCYHNCIDEKCLLIHIQTNHFRFHISERTNNNNVAEAETAAIKLQFDIWCDDIYDGSYLGNPYDTENSLHLGYSQCRLQPSKRSSVTYILVNK